MLDFNVLTIFPEMFESFIGASILKRAIEAGLVRVETHDFREFTQDKHRRVDDYPFGGGAGMLIAAQSVVDCMQSLPKSAGKSISIYMSPSGRPLSTDLARELSEYDRINILCGHYEGVDQRIIDECIDMEISIGDYVLTGGELPAMVLIDCVIRHVDGVLGNDESACDESFSLDGLLEYPQYTRPADFRGKTVPEVLLSGHHANIRKWQREQALIKTAQVRPELLETARLDKKDMDFLAEKGFWKDRGEKQ